MRGEFYDREDAEQADAAAREFYLEALREVCGVYAEALTRAAGGALRLRSGQACERVHARAVLPRGGVVVRGRGWTIISLE